MTATHDSEDRTVLLLCKGAVDMLSRMCPQRMPACPVGKDKAGSSPDPERGPACEPCRWPCQRSCCAWAASGLALPFPAARHHRRSPHLLMTHPLNHPNLLWDCWGHSHGCLPHLQLGMLHYRPTLMHTQLLQQSYEHWQWKHLFTPQSHAVQAHTTRPPHAAHISSVTASQPLHHHFMLHRPA